MSKLAVFLANANLFAEMSVCAVVILPSIVLTLVFSFPITSSKAVAVCRTARARSDLCSLRGPRPWGGAGLMRSGERQSVAVSMVEYSRPVLQK